LGKLPCATGNMDFSLTIRDSNTSCGRAHLDLMTVTNTGPFDVVTPDGGKVLGGGPSISCTTSQRLYSPNNPNFPTPNFCKKYFVETASTPMPYFALRLKFIEDASSKYLVGHVTSAIENPAKNI